MVPHPSTVLRGPWLTSVTEVFFIYSLDVVEKYDKFELDKRGVIKESAPLSTNNTLEKLIAKGNQGKQWIFKKYQVDLQKGTYLQVGLVSIHSLSQ